MFIFLRCFFIFDSWRSFEQFVIIDSHEKAQPRTAFPADAAFCDAVWPDVFRENQPNRFLIDAIFNLIAYESITC